MVATTRPKTPTLLTATALSYAERQWPVFPLKPGTKYPATPNHPADKCDGTDPKCVDGHAGWEPRATCDPVRIRNAWARRNYGIAIACGPANLLVIDLDIAKGQKNSGAVSLHELEQHHSQTLPDTFTVATPSGGYHLYYQQPNGAQLRNSANKVGDGIDTRGHGGYVVAPKSQLAGVAFPYSIIHDLPAQILPQWFSELLTTPTPKTAEPLPQKTSQLTIQTSHQNPRVARYVESAISHQLDRLAHAPIGQRNTVLFATAVSFGQLIGAGVADETTIIERIKTAASVHVGTKCTWSEIDRTITSGIRKGIQEPRQLPQHLTEKP